MVAGAGFAECYAVPEPTGSTFADTQHRIKSSTGFGSRASLFEIASEGLALTALRLSSQVSGCWMRSTRLERLLRSSSARSSRFSSPLSFRPAILPAGLRNRAFHDVERSETQDRTQMTTSSLACGSVLVVPCPFLADLSDFLHDHRPHDQPSLP